MNDCLQLYLHANLSTAFAFLESSISNHRRRLAGFVASATIRITGEFGASVQTCKGLEGSSAVVKYILVAVFIVVQ